MNGRAGCGEWANGGEGGGVGEPCYEPGLWRRWVKRQGNGEREASPMNGGAGLGEPANRAANRIYGEERAERP